jgi:predicted metalloprotease
MTRRPLALLSLLAILLTGCSTAASGTAVVRSTATAGSTPVSIAPSTTRSSTTAVSTVSAAALPLCHAVVASDARGIVGCLRTSLSTFWSKQLDQVVDQPVIIEPTAAQVPERCRSAITTTSAFTCQLNNTVYLNAGLLDSARKLAPGEMLYVFAAVLGHEIGHVVQAAVKQPNYTDTGASDAISQRIEQQADCLDGVWAHAVVAAGQLDRATFVRVTNTFVTSISSNPEIAAHGTPPVRAAALAKGLKNGRPQDCGLATFS